jgi:hypothetical protein
MKPGDTMPPPPPDPPSRPRASSDPKITIEIAEDSAHPTHWVESEHHASIVIRVHFDKTSGRYVTAVDQIPNLTYSHPIRQIAELRTWSWALRSIATEVESEVLRMEMDFEQRSG